jgi:hypothetical protein
MESKSPEIISGLSLFSVSIIADGMELIGNALVTEPQGVDVIEGLTALLSTDAGLSLVSAAAANYYGASAVISNDA